MKESHPITAAARELARQITVAYREADTPDANLVKIVVDAIRRVNDAGDVVLSGLSPGNSKPRRQRVRLAVPDETDSANDAVAEDREDLPT